MLHALLLEGYCCRLDDSVRYLTWDLQKAVGFRFFIYDEELKAKLKRKMKYGN